MIVDDKTKTGSEHKANKTTTRTTTNKSAASSASSSKPEDASNQPEKTIDASKHRPKTVQPRNPNNVPKNPNSRSSKGKRLRGDLTEGQATFIQELAKGKTQQEAAMIAYPNQSYKTASVTASRLLDNPKIMDRLKTIDFELEDTMLDIMRFHRKKRNRLAFDVAAYVHDKRHGKAKQQIETNSQVVQINIDLTGAE